MVAVLAVALVAILFSWPALVGAAITFSTPVSCGYFEMDAILCLNPQHPKYSESLQRDDFWRATLTLGTSVSR